MTRADAIRALIVFALAAAAVPAAAQDEGEGGVATEVAEENASPDGEEVAGEATSDQGIMPAGGIYLVSGPEALTTLLGTEEPLAESVEVCLAVGEVAVFSSERTLFEMSGEDCVILGDGEAEAYGLSLLVEEEAAQAASGTPVAAASSSGGGGYSGGGIVIRSGGPTSATYPVGTRIAASARLCLQNGDRVTLLSGDATRVFAGPGCFDTRRSGTSSRSTFAQLTRQRSGRARTGAIRGGSASDPGSRPVVFRVAAGSDSAIERYPRRSIVNRSSRICLEDGEQITIIGSNGQRVTYSGPGCARRTARPSADNIGGFVFG